MYLRAIIKALVLTLVLVLAAGCATTSVTKTAPSPLVTNTVQTAEAQLLDVGIGVFDPGLDEVDDDDLTVFPDVRVAEARYLPNFLMNTMQRTGFWGVVRVIPEDLLNSDINVQSTILVSTGESLKLRVKVTDSSGRHWYTREYKNVASRYSYARTTAASKREPFQDVYNHIANDIAEFKATMSEREITHLRTVSELKFAQDFSPEAFGGHLEKDSEGLYKVVRLPADGDPMMDRIAKIKERDDLFVDTMQDYYNAFSDEMEMPYHEWRAQTYQEIVAYNELQEAAKRQKVAAGVAVIGGLIAAGSSNRTTRQAGNILVYGGARVGIDSISKKAESQIHLDAMEELGDSLSVDLSTSVIELDDNTYTLQGDVSAQYLQWKEILKDLYAEETGIINAALPTPTIEPDATN